MGVYLLGIRKAVPGLFEIGSNSDIRLGRPRLFRGFSIAKSQIHTFGTLQDNPSLQRGYIPKEVFMSVSSYFVTKRDGTVVGFDIKKICAAIRKAFDAKKIPVDDGVIELIALRATADFQGKIKEGKISVEDIQDSVEKVLSDAGYAEVAKAYILYRMQRERARNVGSTLLDYKALVDDYLNVNDWRVKENSTVNYSLGGLILSNSGAISANYWLSEIYDDEIANAHRSAAIHIHDLSMISGYCAGWNLKQLIQEGLGGVPGKITSAPASHLATLCNQMVNFLGIMQNEWAGAQAFSSFDTYLAPFVRADNLSYKQVKQSIQSFVYGVNTPSRWGCVPEDTQVLTESGWKNYKDLVRGENIYTWKDGKLELCRLNEIVVKEHHGVLHMYAARGYNQTVTPDHRVLCKKHNVGEYVIRHSDEIFNTETPYYFPTVFVLSGLENKSHLTESEVKFAAIVYGDGSIDMQNGKVHKVIIYKSPDRYGNEEIVDLANELGLQYSFTVTADRYDSLVNKYIFYGESARKIADIIGRTDTKDIDDKFVNMDSYLSELFIRTWCLHSANADRAILRFDNETIADKLQHIALRAGYTSYKKYTSRANYVKIRQTTSIQPSTRIEIPYDGIVWCPNDDNGTAVFRSPDGEVFISGQCQAPFSNITLDWTVPNDLKNLPAIVGGKEMDYTYGDCKKEMDMINKAFLEIMIEGDANGRGFQYPIPTYSITRDFDWSDTENNRLLFEMTAKYGTPYFSNYVNSDMEPSDLRSMCPLYGDEKVLVRDDYSKEFHVSRIRNLYKGSKKDNVYDIILNGETKRAAIHKYDDQTFYKIRTMNGHEVILSGSHANLVHGGEIKRTDELTCQDYLPFNVVPFEGRGLTFEDGLMVGAFMGDGSLNGDYSVVYSLNDSTKQDLLAEVIQIATNKFGAKVNLNTVHEHCINVAVTSRMLRGLVEEYVTGKALDKELNAKCVGKSLAFREGILEGYRRTDGGNKNRIYSASKNAIESLATMLTSMGIPSRISVDERDSTETLSDNPVYCIRTYDVDHGQMTYADIYRKSGNYMWFRIESIEPFATSAQTGYCFEVLEDDEPYFTLPCGLVTHNCRLRLDLRELRKKSGGFFGAGESTGSVGVVTINMPRIAYLAKDEKDFYDRLDHLMDISARSLKVKRNVITKLMDQGLYPYTKRYLGTFNNHFSTIGLIGMNEVGLNANWLRADLTSKKVQEFTIDVLNHMRERLSDYQEMYGDLYNLEATPAESTTYRFAKHDKEQFPDIITANMNGTPYYTNSSHLPVGFTDDIFSALDIQDPLQVLYTSGTVFHGFLGEKLPDWKAAANLVRKIAENYKLPYYTLSPTYSVCADHGYLTGEQSVCPHCGKPTEVYSRITGYYRPVQNWNDGKQQEFKDRVVYNIGRSHFRNDPVPEKKEMESAAEELNEEKESAKEDVIYLFKTPTCPNCRIAAQILDEHGIKYQPVDCSQEFDLVSEYDIMQAPTMVVRHEGQIETLRGVSDIIGWINTNKNQN